MNWQQQLQDLGVPPIASMDPGSLIIILLAIVGAYWVGWYAGRRTRPPLDAYLKRLGGRTAGWSVTELVAVMRYAVTAVLLLIVGNVVHPIGVSLMALALADGLAAGLLVVHICKLIGLAKIPVLVLSGVAFSAAAAGTLGGMTPLIAGLEGVAFSVGSHRFSLLLLANAAITIALLILLARVVNGLIIHAIGRSKALDLSQRVLVQKLAGIGVIVVFVLLGIDLLGIDLTALAVFSGALGLAVGFGLQKTFGNLIAGLILLMDRSIKPGDVIVVGDTFGAVNKIGVRAVSVVTRDGKEHLIPNEQLMTESVENWSYSSRNVRVHIPVGVAYSSDLALAQRLMVEAAVAAHRVLADPKPSVWLKAFGDSSVDHEILVWIADPEMGVGNVRSDILNRLWVSFAENKIEIPFPQRDLHIRSMPK